MIPSLTIESRLSTPTLSTTQKILSIHECINEAIQTNVTQLSEMIEKIVPGGAQICARGTQNDVLAASGEHFGPKHAPGGPNRENVKKT